LKKKTRPFEIKNISLNFFSSNSQIRALVKIKKKNEYKKINVKFEKKISKGREQTVPSLFCHRCQVGDNQYVTSFWRRSKENKSFPLLCKLLDKKPLPSLYVLADDQVVMTRGDPSPIDFIKVPKHKPLEKSMKNSTLFSIYQKFPSPYQVG